MAAKKRARIIDCCISCHSPHLTMTMVNGTAHYSCLRCGYEGVGKEQKGPERLRSVLRRRKVSAHHLHRVRSRRKKEGFHEYVRRFHLRMWFRLVSVFLLVTGFVLLMSSAWATGVVFLVIGAVGLYNGEKF